MTFSLYDWVEVIVLAASPYRMALKIGALRKNGGGSGTLHAPSPFNFSLSASSAPFAAGPFWSVRPATARIINGAFENEPTLQVKVRKSTEDVSEDFGKLPTMTRLTPS